MRFLQRILILLALGISSVEAVISTTATLTVPSVFPQKAKSSYSLVPVKDFGLVLTFAETVQKGSSTLQLKVTDKATDALIAETAVAEKAFTVGCSSLATTAKWFGKYVLVPVTSELKANADQDIRIPTACFKSYPTGSVTEEKIMPHLDLAAANTGNTLKITTENSAYASSTCYAGGKPFLLTGKQPTSAAIPQSPAHRSWITAASTKFDLYFSEKLLMGEGSITMYRTTGAKATTAIATFQAKSPTVKFDTKVPGRVEIGDATWFTAGAEYRLVIGEAAFKDTRGNFLDSEYATDGTTTSYKVYMTTTLAKQYPSNNCCSKSATQNFTTNHRMVLEFADNVIPGTNGAVKLCSSWAADNACKTSKSLATNTMVFLGKKVIVNPQGQAEAGSTYNVSIESSTSAQPFLYYSGMSADSSRQWSYSFSLDDATVHDKGEPELVGAYVDCSRNGLLTAGTTGTNRYSDTCDTDGDSKSDFVELEDSLKANGATALPVTFASNTFAGPSFKLYFREKVALKTGAKATLVADDGSATTDLTAAAGLVVNQASATQHDMLVTMTPTLKTGKRYTLSIGAGEITDAGAKQKNPWQGSDAKGTSFMFYTPLHETTSARFPSGSNVAKETLIRLTFRDAPRMGPTPGMSIGSKGGYLSISGGPTDAEVTEKLYLDDTDSVKWQGMDVLFLPKQPLMPGTKYKVTMTKHHIRYMTSDISWDFTTRSEDDAKPQVLMTWPLLAKAQTRNGLDTSAAGADAVVKPEVAGKVPWVLFSEGVTGVKGGVIKISEDTPAAATKGQTYAIKATDTCAVSGTNDVNDAADAKGCIKYARDYGNKVYFYPKGQTATSNKGVATNWATAGRTYTVTIEGGSFSDSRTTGVNNNPLDEVKWDFTVGADVLPPVLTSIESHGPGSSGTALSMVAQKAKDKTIMATDDAFFLNFNEPVKAGTDAFDIQKYAYSTLAPALDIVGTQDASQWATDDSACSNVNSKQCAADRTSGTRKMGKDLSITLVFDSKIQKGSSFPDVWTDGATPAVLDATIADDVAYVANKAIFVPGTFVLGNSYYVKAGASAFKSASYSAAASAAIDTSAAATMMKYHYETSSLTNAAKTNEEMRSLVKPVIVHNTLDDYSCYAADGSLPDADLYWSLKVKLKTGIASSPLTIAGDASPSNMGTADDLCDLDLASSDAASCATKNTANSHANSASSETIKLQVGISTKMKFKSTLFLASKRNPILGSKQNTGFPIVLKTERFTRDTAGWSDGALTRNAVVTIATTKLCEVRYGQPTATSTVRVYLPTGATLGATTVSSAVVKPTQFVLTVPAAAVKDANGISASGAATVYSWSNEVDVPTFDSSTSNPQQGASTASTMENVVLAFNEVVQGGTGAIEVMECADATCASASAMYEVKTDDSAVVKAKFIGRKVIITPRTTCHDTRRRAIIPPVPNATAPQVNASTCVSETECGENIVNPNFNPNTNNHTCHNITICSRDGVNISWSKQLWYSASRRLEGEEDSEIASVEEGTFDAEGRQLSHTSTGATCKTPTGLTAGKKYYVRSASGDAGVVKDVFGNPVAKINTKSSWSWSPATLSELTPSLVGCDQPDFNVGSKILTGMCYFSEKIQAASPAPSLSLQDCGADFTCGETESRSYGLTGSDLSYGDGSSQDGTTEYGMLRYTKKVYNNHRRYKLTIPADSVRDMATAVQKNAAAHTFEFSIGSAATPDSTDGPVIKAMKPTSGKYFSTDFGAVSGGANNYFTMYFNEDIQQGSGRISFCLNSDASADVACNPGRFDDNSAATHDIGIGGNNTDDITRRVQTIDLTSKFKSGQTLYMMMPAGLVKDTTPSSNAYKTGMLMTDSLHYSFTIKDVDDVKPKLQMIEPALATSGNGPTLHKKTKINMYFSEAVQSWTGSNWTENSVDVTSLVQGVTISGNMVSIIPGLGYWTSGKTYITNMAASAFADLKGNLVDDATTMVGQRFTVNADDTAPVMNSADKTSAAHSTQAFSLEFNEVVQIGTGKVSILQDDVLLETFDIKTLPYISTTGSSKRSKMVVKSSSDLLAGKTYKVVVPSGSISDVWDNNYGGTGATYARKVVAATDCTAPTFIGATLGKTNAVSPNPSFAIAGNEIVMYFSESVAKQATGSVQLVESNGGSNCDAGAITSPPYAKECGAASSDHTSVCTTACGYTAAAATIQITALKVEGNKVTATVPTLEAGKGYKLKIDKEAFSDLNMNSLAADVDGSASNTVYVLKTAAAETDSTGPMHTTGSKVGIAYPLHADDFPTTGSLMVHPSVAIQLSFSENVQMGTGAIELAKSDVGSATSVTVKVPVSNCMFSGVQMRCKPEGNLEGKKVYSVTVPEATVKDHAGLIMKYSTNLGKIGSVNSKLSFTTIDMDFTHPVVGGVAVDSFAMNGIVSKTTSVGPAMPFDPPDKSTKIAKGTIIALSFSETVQQGEGSILISRKETSSTTSGNQKINVVNPTATVSNHHEATLHYSGKTVYIQPKGTLTQAGNYEITTTSQADDGSLSTVEAGVFRDVEGNPLAEIKTGAVKFTLVPDDTAAPKILQMLPKDDTVLADDAPGTMITLYFSEAVQSIAAKNVVITGTGTTTIPVDNTDLTKGSVSVVGAVVTIDPFDDLGYDKVVNFKIDAGAFKDLFGDNDFEHVAAGYNFKTPSFSFQLKKNNNQTFPFSQREGMTVHSMSQGEDGKEFLMVYGGWDGASCLDDTWISTDMGVKWKPIESKVINNTQVGKRAYAKTAVDMHGCVWMFGHSALCGASSKMVYRTQQPCEPTSMDTTLMWEQMPAPMSKSEDADWMYDSTGIVGNAVAIVGGWQFVVVDSVAGHVWKALDRNATVMHRVAKDVPWTKRTDPMLLTTSTNELFLTGGYDASKCKVDEINCKHVFTDVWKSMDSGETWKCMTANYDPSLTTEYSNGVIKSLGLGRGTSTLMAHDDTMFIMAGAKPNYTTSLNTVWTNYASLPDTTKPALIAEQDSPPATPDVMTETTIHLYFTESVFYHPPLTSSTGVTGPDLRLELNCAVSAACPAIVKLHKAAIDTQINRQRLTISLKDGAKFKPDHHIKLSIPAASLRDASGNTLAGDLTKNWDVTDDIVGPIFSSFKVATSSDAAAPTGVSPTTMVMLQADEWVYPVMDAPMIKISSSVLGLGNEVALSLDDQYTEIRNVVVGAENKAQIFLQMPDDARLTENTEFTIHIPKGMVTDKTGNLNGKVSTFKFTTISGEFTARNFTDLYESTLGSEWMYPLNVNDTTAPTFKSMWPPVNAGDVLVSKDVSVYVFFDEEVQWNATSGASVDILNSTNKIVGHMNVTQELIVSGTPRIAHVVGENATKIMVGEFLKDGETFTVRIAANAIVDRKGNKNAAVSKSFNTLKKLKDTTGPEVLFGAPYAAQAKVLSSEYKVDVWFNEKIKAGAGSITLKKGTNMKYMSITDKNLTIDGAHISMSFFKDVFNKGAAADAGAWDLVLPSGLVFDMQDQKFTGLNSTNGNPTYKFTIAAADVAKPTLTIGDANPIPLNEATLGFAQGASTSLQINFNEAVQKNMGKVTLNPKYASDTITVDVASMDVAIQGAKIVVIPDTDMEPGEVYSVMIDAGAFKDLEGNEYAGLKTGWSFSTMALMGFKQVITAATVAEDKGYFDNDGTGVTGAFFSGERYGAGATFDSKSNLFVMGGKNGTNGATARLNDVFMLATKRETNCAAAPLPVSDCSTDGKPPTEEDKNIVTECNGDKAGKSNFVSKIWRSPTAGGRKCMSSKALGSRLMSQLDDITKTGFTECPCPHCELPPDVNTTAIAHQNISDHTFAALLPVTADAGTLPLVCAQPGWRPNASFVCEFKSLTSAAFSHPMPVCERKPCLKLPDLALYSGVTLGECNASAVLDDDVKEWRDKMECPYTCPLGSGASMATDTVGYSRDMGDMHDGLVTCSGDDEKWNIDATGGCKLLACDTGGKFRDWECSTSKDGKFAAITAEPTYGMYCRVKCYDESTVLQQCTIDVKASRAEVVAPTMQGADKCPTTTTTTTTTTLAPTKTVTIATEVSMSVDQMYLDLPGFKENPIGNVKFVAATKAGIVEGIRAGSKLLATLDASAVTITKMFFAAAGTTAAPVAAGTTVATGAAAGTTAAAGAAAGTTAAPAAAATTAAAAAAAVTTAAPAAAATTAAAAAAAGTTASPAVRRLAVGDITVEYEIELPAALSEQAEEVKTQMVAGKAAFQEAMAVAYVAAEAAQGNVVAKPTVVQSTVFAVTVVTVAPVGGAATTTGAPPTSAPTSAPTTAPPAVVTTPEGTTPKAAAGTTEAAEEEGGGNAGMIVGVVIGAVVGVAALGGLFYMYKKKQATE